MALAAIGVYGVMPQTALERMREIALRLAIGASSGDILKLVFVHGARRVIVGLALGISASLAVGNVLQSLLVFRGISTQDPLTFTAAVSTLVLAALIACYAPAHRAARIEPITVLKGE